jgi:hypothetical protein
MGLRASKPARAMRPRCVTGPRPSGGPRERIDCGPGDDVVHADRGDRLIGCEHVKYRPDPYAHVTPRSGSLGTRFRVGFIAPYNARLAPNDEGAVGYDFQTISAPRKSCQLIPSHATPFPGLGDHYAADFKIHPARASCHGAYTIAVTFENTSLGVECNSRSGSRPKTAGDYGDCPFTDTISCFTFRVR